MKNSNDTNGNRTRDLPAYLRLPFVQRPNRTLQWVQIAHPIWEVLGSEFQPVTNYPDWRNLETASRCTTTASVQTDCHLKREGSCSPAVPRPPPTQDRNLKKTRVSCISAGAVISEVLLICRPAEISHGNRLTSSKLEFWQIKYKPWEVFDELKKNQDQTFCFKLSGRIMEHAGLFILM